VWTSPSGQTHVTTPGSAILFPSLCITHRGVRAGSSPAAVWLSRTAMMPKRRRTRAQKRANYVAAERRHNRKARLHEEPPRRSADRRQRRTTALLTADQRTYVDADRQESPFAVDSQWTPLPTKTQSG